MSQLYYEIEINGKLYFYPSNYFTKEEAMEEARKEDSNAIFKSIQFA